MIGITLFLLLISDSLTVSPIGLSFHGKENAELAPYAPRKLDSKANWTWHPELNLIYKQKYMQYSLYFMKDTVDQPAGGFFLGPKIDFLSQFSIGTSIGTLIRPSRYYSGPGWTINGVQIIPMAGITFSFKIPVTKNVSFETNVFGNYFINHAVSGLRIDW